MMMMMTSSSSVIQDDDKTVQYTREAKQFTDMYDDKMLPARQHCGGNIVFYILLHVP